MRPWQANLLALGVGVVIAAVGLLFVMQVNRHADDPASAPASTSSQVSVQQSPSTRPGSSGTPTRTAPKASHAKATVRPTLYVLGDSLTVGMQKAGLAHDLASAGWKVRKINALGGRTLMNGVGAARDDASQISKSGAAVVALGTNDIEKPESQVVSDMQTLINRIKHAQPKIKIFWVDFYLRNTAGAKKINHALRTVIGENHITIIPWGSSHEVRVSMGPDGVHMTAPGFKTMARFVARAIRR